MVRGLMSILDVDFLRKVASIRQQKERGGTAVTAWPGSCGRGPKVFGVDAEIRVIGRVLAHKLPVLLSTHYQYILKRCITVYHYRITYDDIMNIYIYTTDICLYIHTQYILILIALLEISQCKFPFSNGSKSFSFSLSPASHCLRGSGRSDRGEEHFGIPLDPICSGYSSEFFQHLQQLVIKIAGGLKCFLFSPRSGDDPIWWAYFSTGLKPTSSNKWCIRSAFF